MTRNKNQGGGGYNYEKEFDFYTRHGFAPGEGGVTGQWTFEDWALARMAEKLGQLWLGPEPNTGWGIE